MLVNKDDKLVSLQVSTLKDMPQGNFVSKNGYFLVKNITEDTIDAEVKLAGNKDYIVTPLYSGWNVEIIEAIKNVQPNTLQYGY